MDCARGGGQADPRHAEGDGMSTTEKPQAAHKTVVGVCESVEVKDDWHKYAIRVDGIQYPLKLSTKKPELVALANAVGKQPATWGYLESQGNENPNRPGTHYMNRYLDSAVILDTVDQPEVFEAIPDELRQRLIIRQTALKAAVELRAASATEGVHVPARLVTELADVFTAWVLNAGAKVQQQPPEALSAGVNDDDIPF